MADKMNIVQTFRMFTRWWRDQLVSLVPAAAMARLAALRTRHRVHVEPGVAALYTRGWLSSRRAWRQMDKGALTPLEMAARLRPRFAWLGLRRKVLITVPVDHLLSRTLELPAGVAADLSDIAALEAGTLVPGSAGSAYSGLDPASIHSDTRTVSARQLVLRGDLIEGYASALNTQKALTTEVSGVLADNRQVRLDPLVDEIADGDETTRWRLILAALFLVLVVANLAITVTRQEEAIAALDQKLAAATQKARQVREELNRKTALTNAIVALQKQTRQQPRLVDVWRELTTLMPKSAWINALAVEDRTLRIAGSAKSAAELIRLLDRSPIISGVRFSSPVVTNLTSNEERFQIEARIGHLQ